MADSLYNRAVMNYNSAIVLRRNIEIDELFLNQIAYNIQQSYEFAIKYILELNGVEYPKTHEIEQLIMIANNNDVDLYVSEYLDEHSEMISQWGSKSRYVMGYLVEQRKIDRALVDLREYLTKVKDVLDHDEE